MSLMRGPRSLMAWLARLVRLARAPALAFGLAMGLALGLSACGGGSTKGGSGTLATGTDATHGALTLGLSGGAQREVEHVWVTIGSVALHSSATQAWSSSDRSWVVLNLPTPVVVDLAQTSQPNTSQSDVSRVLEGVSVPQGSYAQMRLFPLAHDADLVDAARNAGLGHNAQVRYTDATLGTQNMPLELPQPAQGWRFEGALNVVAGQSNYVVLQSDVQHNLVRLASSDGRARFGWRSQMSGFDLTSSGAIFGYIDPARLCGGTGAAAAPNCASEVIASAQRLSADGSRYESVRAARVGTGGGFALYPLPSASQFDVVITGRHMQTMVIRAVTVSAFNVLTTLDWSALGSTTSPLTPVIVPGTAPGVSLSAAVVPGSGALRMGQTLAAAGKPHEVATQQRDPFTGRLARELTVPAGPLSVATFTSSGAALSFADETPVEGLQGFSAQAAGRSHDDDGAVATVSAPAPGSLIAVPNPSLKAGVGTGLVNVTLTGALSPSYDQAMVVVADVDGIVQTQSVSGAGSVSLAVPAGANAAAHGGALYSVAVRATGASGTLRWVRAPALVDLRAGGSVGVTLPLP